MVDVGCPGVGEEERRRGVGGARVLGGRGGAERHGGWEFWYWYSNEGWWLVVIWGVLAMGEVW